MKNIVIGDIHGKDVWKKLIPKEYDSLTFVGDYFDCFEEIPTVTQVRNFKEICDFASVDPRVNLCIGNHDNQYLDKDNRCSGFQYYGQWDIKEAIQQNLDLLNLIYIIDDTIISHAGVSKAWLRTNNNLDLKNVNEEYKKNFKLCSFVGLDGSGDDVTQSPLWIRPRSLLFEPVDGFKQIVGHTHTKDIYTKDGVTFVDCLDTVEKVYEF